jgi:tight adherence protein C
MDAQSHRGEGLMDSIILYLAASALVLGVGGALALALLGRTQVAGVARSLALIERAVRPSELGKNDLPVTERLVKPILESMSNVAMRLSPDGAAKRLEHLLDMAGNPPMWTPERLFAVKGAGLMVFGVVGLAFGGLSLTGLLAALALATVGFFLPNILLYNAGLKRQDELRRGLADALDMLTVCVEAGQGFDAALLQVARSVKGPIAGEFARVLTEIQIGKGRGEAFSSLSKRTNVTEVKTFVSALIQADRLGLPIGRVLREQAQQMRLIRRQRAEEQAMKVPVKILFPLMLCILPALFVVVIGPGVIRTIALFSHMG